MKKFFLCTLFVFQKLDIIDNQTVNGAIFFLKIFDSVILDSINNFIGKHFAGYVFYLGIRIAF